MKKIVVLISGRGSNMEALLKADMAAHVVAVISNNPKARGLLIAQAHGVATAVVDHRQYATREDFDAVLANAIERYQPDLVVLAGFMRILTGRFVEQFQGRLINIHPSLLPAFPGTHTHRRALEEGVKIHGCSVHFVTPNLDSGPIIVQAAVPVFDDDTEDSLAARVLAQEHRLLPVVVRWYVQDRLRIEGQRVRHTTASKSDTHLIYPTLL